MTERKDRVVAKTERGLAVVIDKLATVYSYADFKARRDAQEKAKERIITLVTSLHKPHKEEPKDVA